MVPTNYTPGGREGVCNVNFFSHRGGWTPGRTSGRYGGHFGVMFSSSAGGTSAEPDGGILGSSGVFPDCLWRSSLCLE